MRHVGEYAELGIELISAGESIMCWSWLNLQLSCKDGSKLFRGDFQRESSDAWEYAAGIGLQRSHLSAASAANYGLGSPPN